MGIELVRSGKQFIGQCNKIRCKLDDIGQSDQDDQGEAWFKNVMENREAISASRFAKQVGSDVLEDFTEYDDFEKFVADALKEDPDFGLYRSIDMRGDTIYVMQHNGFEFFWRESPLAETFVDFVNRRIMEME